MKNQANRVISTERKERKRKYFEEEESAKQKWRLAKEESGLVNHSYTKIYEG